MTSQSNNTSDITLLCSLAACTALLCACTIYSFNQNCQELSIKFPQLIDGSKCKQLRVLPPSRHG